MPPISHLAWLIPLLPLLVFVAIALLAHRSPALSHQLSILGVAASTVLASFTLLAEIVAGRLVPQFPSIRWFSLGTHAFPLGIYVDPLGALLLFALALVCLIILVYALETVHGGGVGDGRLSGLLSLFTACALGMLVFDNLLISFLLWEIMDACAYLMIGLRHDREAARRAALRAFLVAKVGDVFLLLGLVLLYGQVGSLAYRDLPDGLDIPGAGFLGTSVPLVAVIACLFFTGVMVRSGQLPFHVWLLDAVEAPAPASALIHTVTTVTGAFLLIRLRPLLDAAAGSLSIPGLGVTVVTLVGVLTALLATFFATAQRDLRRAVSLSVIGQLGYAVSAMGLGAYVAGVFHLVVGVFSGTLLFLAAGSVARGMTSGGEGNPNDMRDMGRLGERQPITFWMFFVGGVALVGLPLVTAGFWSKGAILMHAAATSPAAFWPLVLAVGLTAFGIMRQLCLVFIGTPRSQAAAHAGGDTPVMALPMLALAVPVLLLGWFGLPAQVPVVGGHWLAGFLGAGEAAPGFGVELTMLWSGVGVTGLTLGFLFYGWRPMRAGETELLELTLQDLRLGGLYAAVRGGFYLDRFYGWAFGRLTVGLAALCAVIDRGLGGIGDGTAWVFEGIAQFCGAVDRHGLSAALDLVGPTARHLGSVCDWLDRRVGALPSLVALGARHAAGGVVFLDRQWGRLLELGHVGVLAVARAGGVLERDLDDMTQGIGQGVRAIGRWFLPETGKAQSHLLTASVALVVLMAVFLFLFT